MSKNNFVENILNRVEGFDSFNFHEFKLIFNNIRHIVKKEYIDKEDN